MLGLGKVHVKADGGKQRFQRVSQNRRPVVATAFQFTFAQKQAVANVQFTGNISQGGLVHQVGAQARQLAFAQLAKLVVEHARHGVIQNAVADEFKALVIGRTVTAVRQRLTQELRLAKRMAQPAGQPVKVEGMGHCLSALACKSKGKRRGMAAGGKAA